MPVSQHDIARPVHAIFAGRGVGRAVRALSQRPQDGAIRDRPFRRLSILQAVYSAGGLFCRLGALLSLLIGLNRPRRRFG
jgi:hypothetical protein